MGTENEENRERRSQMCAGRTAYRVLRMRKSMLYTFKKELRILVSWF